MKLQELIVHSYETVPYYTNLFKENSIDPYTIVNESDLVNIPILTKRDIKTNSEDLVSSIYKGSELIEERTSGSTGEPLSIYKRKEDKISANFSMAKFRLMQYGITSNIKLCYFYMFSRNQQGELTINPVIKTSDSLSLNVFVAEEEQLDSYIEVINEYKPEMILSIPSSLFILAKYIEKSNRQITNSIRYIELKGEYVSDIQISKIEQIFNAKVINHYGSTETYGIAFSCKEGYLHVLHDNVIVEIVDDCSNQVKPYEVGKLCVTSLNNKGMPLIRYMLGDEAIYYDENQKCTCGHKGKRIKILSGRVTEYITLKNGFELNSGILYFAIEKLNFNYQNVIVHFQVIQENVDKFLVYLVLQDKIAVEHERLESNFIDLLNDYGLSEVKWEFIYCEHIIPSKITGKHKYFINNCKGT